MKKVFLAVAFSATVLLSSCATVFTGTTQTVQVNSNPPKADIEVDGVKVGVTPMAVPLKKGFNGQTVSLKLEGYETKTFTPKVTFNAVSVVNLLIPVGFIVDAATGSMMKYNPVVIEHQLEPQKAPVK
ncbi:PEGA domain-containing protein [Pedobacter sp. MW01-1-1]|uniref:PEGA domain-containing protein n=1 Tax=Pedobacter sp. MW01-1-1 TaxID=3383027 RepID=UPI003FEFAC7F